MELKGVYPALATPLTQDEKVDKAGMRKVTRYCLDGGVSGVVVMGSTGEFPAMTEAMRQDAIDTVLDEVKGKVPVLIGCGEPGTQRTIEQVRKATKTKADGVLVALPYYFPLDQAAVIRHYEMVADASTLPVVMYNFPQMTKITMTPDTMAKLAAHPNIIGVKDSSGDFFNMQRFLDVTAGADFAVMSGNPALGVSAYQLGAKGGIFAGCSLVPKLCADVYSAFIKGDLAGAIELQKKASLIPMMGGFGPNAAVIKLGLSKLGICDATVSAPLGMAAGQEEKIFAWMRRLGLKV
ncbi:MAG: dihydrodipicolinate synthase family protein [Negativicutes bacterium]|nr:dihydrodipicolinate synthase family protein [Negativicutes bacterium]